MTADQLADSLATGGAFLAHADPAHELGEATGQTADEVVANIRQAAQDAGVYLDDKSLKDLSEQVWENRGALVKEGMDSASDAGSQMYTTLKQMYNTLTDAEFWEQAAASQQSAHAEVADLSVQAYNMLSHVLSNPGASYQAAYDAIADGAEYGFTTELGTIWRDTVDLVSPVTEGITSFTDGFGEGYDLNGEFGPASKPKAPEAMQKQIEAQAAQEQGKTADKQAEPDSGPKPDGFEAGG